MNKCIDFCKERNKANSTEIIKESAWNDAIEYDLNTLLSATNFTIPEEYKCDTVEHGVVTVRIKHNPNDDFSYYTQQTYTYDGTLSVLLEGMAECMNRVLACSTYDKQVGLPDLSKNSIFNYTIGNFVVVSEHGDFSKDKPWLQEKSTIMLPIKFSWEYEK